MNVQPVASKHKEGARASASILAEAPVTVLELNQSAYHLQLGFDRSALIVVSPDSLYRIAPGAVAERWALEEQSVVGAIELPFITFSKGRLFRRAEWGAPPLDWAALQAFPAELVGSGRGCAWLEGSREQSVYRIHSCGAVRRVLYETSAPLAGLVVLGGWVFFTETVDESGYRIGGVSLDGGTPRFSEAFSGRRPSQLYAGDSLYFYDINTHALRRVSPDFVLQDVIAKQVICSPLAISDRVVCAEPGGIFQLSLPEGHRMQLASESGGLVVAVAASSRHVAWVVDGAKASVRVLELPSD